MAIDLLRVHCHLGEDPHTNRVDGLHLNADPSKKSRKTAYCEQVAIPILEIKPPGRAFLIEINELFATNLLDNLNMHFAPKLQRQHSLR